MYDSPTRFAFTQRALDSLTAHDRDSRSSHLELCDSACIGLRISVSKTGRKLWYFRYTFRGQKHCIKLGEFPAVGLKAAREYALKYRASIADDIDPAEARVQEKAATLTFGEFTDEHYLPHARSANRRPDVIISRLNTGALPFFKDRRLDSITTRDVQQFHTKLRERVSPTTANHHLIVLKAMLNLAVKWEMLPKNPCVGIKKFQEPTGRDRYLSLDEVKRFLEACDACDNVPVASGLRTLLFTGLRSQEVFSLPWADVDFEAKSIYLRKTKAGKARRVYLSSMAWAEIERMKAAHDGAHKFVFPGFHPGQHVMEPHRCFKGILKAAKIEDFRIHDLRHTHASYLVQSGASLFEVQKALGHSDSSMTQRYAHLADNTLRDRAEIAVQRLTGTDG